jgi:hypothetical protein
MAYYIYCILIELGNESWVVFSISANGGSSNTMMKSIKSKPVTTIPYNPMQLKRYKMNDRFF